MGGRTLSYLCKHYVYTVGLQDGAGHLKWVAGHALVVGSGHV